MSLNEKVILITGAAQGFGRVIAQECARNGATIIACDINNCDETVKLVKAEGVKAIGLSFDVTDYDSCKAAVDQSVKELGRVDGLVNNGGVFGSLTLAPFNHIDADEWDLVMRVNLKGTWHMCKAVTPYMQAAGKGSIVNISSNTVQVGPPMMSHYVASKAAIIGLTRCLATELGQDNIRVNSVCPGVMDTAGSKKCTGDNLKILVEANPGRLKTFLDPVEVAGTIKFLISDDSLVMTGQTLAPDGGLVML
jgi:NAD(P)-dependent dehydrogenase (short-subunit alcohol dehydrogenase family)